MRTDFVQIQGKNFVINGETLLLRGWALGSWMNFEHFMMGLPGTHSMIQSAFSDVYGKENAKKFFDDLLNQFVKEEDIKYLKGIGINSIRIPFGYHHFIDDRNPDVFLEEGFEVLDRVIKLCEKYKLFVILDLHSAPGAQNTDWHSDNITGQALFWKYSCFQTQVVKFWNELASRYADNKWIVGYDVINEPGYGLTKEELIGFYDRVISAIRDVDKDHIIFLEGDDFGRSFKLFDPPKDPQVTYVVHFYPFVLDENVLDPEFDEERRIEIFQEIFYRQIKNMEKFNRPIWCGESGYEFIRHSMEFYSKLIGYNIKLCEENNISWNLWTYKDARRMGIAVPKEDSLWMKLYREIGKLWSHEREQVVSMELVKYTGEKYFQPLDEKLMYDLDFRMRSILHRIAVEQILKPALRKIPLDRMKEYPKSFAFEECDFRDVIVNDVKSFIER